jgi:hypothetical protein
MLLLFAVGCGQIKVEGKVTFPDGTPLHKGKVAFEDEQHTFTANIREDGTFRMGMVKDGEGIPAGHYKVAIIGALDEKYADDLLKNPFPEITYLIAKKFSSSKTSGIEYDVQKKITDILIIVEPPSPSEEKKKMPTLPKTLRK